MTHPERDPPDGHDAPGFGRSEPIGSKDRASGTANARQLPLDLPVATSFLADDFLVGASNQPAHRWVESWPDWPSRLMRLVGPRGSGKSHLASILAARSGAAIVTASAIDDGVVPEVATHSVLVIEDLDRGPLHERAMFHLLNLMQERRSHLVLTSTLPIERWGLALPDLSSRLRLAPSIEIGPPDDALLKAVLVKLFFDRQLPVDANVVAYLAARIERSLAAASRIVAQLDREGLSRGRRITRSVAAEVLGEVLGEAQE